MVGAIDGTMLDYRLVQINIFNYLSNDSFRFEGTHHATLHVTNAKEYENLDLNLIRCGLFFKKSSFYTFFGSV